jgi:aldehyde dehydrogenase (NAD+)
MQIAPLFSRLGLDAVNSGVSIGGKWTPSPGGEEIVALNPTTGAEHARVRCGTDQDVQAAIAASLAVQLRWRLTPGPQRGEIIRQLGQALRESRSDLGALVTLEAGKIRSEGLGEVQEMIDMCDFAVGLSRQLYGLTMPSERPRHRLFEQWHPLGVVGVITAFNFPVAVWAWNAAVAAVCGDSVVWKPSELTPLTAIAVQNICDRVLAPHGFAGLFSTVIGSGETVGAALCADSRVPLVSATGSCAMGRLVGVAVQSRLGRVLLELGGNNAAIITPTANLDLALRGVLFAAVGTAGQRCTTLRRLIVHRSRIDEFTSRLSAAFRSVPAGDPWDDGVLLGPLIRERSVAAMTAALAAARQQGADLVCGGNRIARPGFFVEPALVRCPGPLPIVKQETFAPILYVLPYDTLEEAIALQNDVPQGLSSSIFTDRVSEAEAFLSAGGSDCGIANVNIGTSGAEIGGAFGGEKETGGGREAGSDAWKAYMRRQTCTVNFGDDLPLSQGVRFDL